MTYTSGLFLQCSLHALPEFLYGEKFNIVCILSMIKYVSYGRITSCSAVLWNEHVPPRPLWCQKYLTLCTSVQFFHPRTQSVVTSSFLSFCFVCFTISLPTIMNCFLMLWFIFLSQRLFKGKVSDIVVLYNRLFVFKLKLFRVETALSYHAL